MSMPRGNFSVTLEGRGKLTVRPDDHVITGGEGSIYAAGSTVLKIYIDPNTKIFANRVVEKVEFFRKNPHPYVVFPQGMIRDQKGKPVGYYMEYIRDHDHGGNAEPIARLFTNDCWKRLGFKHHDASKLVDRMRDVIRFAHDHQAITVDANELGYFVIPKGAKGPEPRMIDVDCWVINGLVSDKLPIMLSIQDWHSKAPFGEMQDWFAWGVVTFQIYTGIHPYKGILDGYLSREWVKRMQENASVFTPGVKMNDAVRDFSLIPGRLLEWYKATFQHGERTMPPSPFDARTVIVPIARVARVVATATSMLVYEKLFDDAKDAVVKIFPSGIVLLESGALVELDRKIKISTALSRDCEIVRVDGGWLKADWDGREIRFSYINNINLQEQPLALQTNGYRLVRYENRLFVVTNRGLSEISLKILGKPILSIGQTWGAMVNSTRWFDGVGIQNALGAVFVIAPFGGNACAQFRVKELDGLVPVVAKAGHRFIVIIALDRQGEYHKLELTMDQSYGAYKLWEGKTDSPDLNISILPKGVCATIVRDGELDIFVPASGALNRVEDRQISTSMSLGNWENTVVYLQNGSVWSVRMK